MLTHRGQCTQNNMNTIQFHFQSLLAEALLLEGVELMDTLVHSFPDTFIDIDNTVVENVGTVGTLCLFRGEAAALPLPSEEISDIEIRAMVVSITVGERMSLEEELEVAFSENTFLLPPENQHLDIALPKFLSELAKGNNNA